MARNLTLEAATGSHDLFLGAVPAAPLEAGVASLVDVTDTEASLVCAAASGGTAPYTYQWQASADGLAGWGDLTGETALTLDLTGLTPETEYFYRCVATDADTSTANSNVVEVVTEAEAPIVTDDDWLITSDGVVGSPQNAPHLRANGRVFVGWANDAGQYYVTEIIEEPFEILPPVLAGTTPDPDRHSNVALVELPDGRLFAVFDDHKNGWWRLSASPGTVQDGWSAAAALLPSGDFTYYTTPIVTDEGAGTERIYVFHTYGTGGREARYIYTDDRGATWSSATSMFSNGLEDVYMTARRSEATGRIICALTQGNPDDSLVTNGYMMIYDPSDGSWTNAPGDALTLPKTPGSDTLFYAAASHGNREMRFTIPAYEDADTIYVLFNTLESGGAARRMIQGRFTAGVWTFYEIVGAAVTAQQPVMNDGHFGTVYAVVGAGFERDVYRYTTADGGATWTGTNLTNGALRPAGHESLTWTLAEIKGGTPTAPAWVLGRWAMTTSDVFEGFAYLGPYSAGAAPVLAGLHIWYGGIRLTTTPVPVSAP